jgi:DNA helicase IV
MLSHLGKPEADLRVLDTGYRVPRQILDFASRLLPHIAPGLSPARSVRQDSGALIVQRVKSAGFAFELATTCSRALTVQGSVAVIAADEEVVAVEAVLAAAQVPHEVLAGAATSEVVTVVPVTLAKGLEFDHVVVVEPAHIAAAEARGLHRLYVALTRAVSRLTVLHTSDLPAELEVLQH